MLHIDSLLLEAFYKENKTFFENAKVQKIQQPTRREIILQLRNNGETRKFYVNISPNLYHACFMSSKNENRRNISIPKQPPMFCMLLRKHMEGAKIVKVNTPKFDRIIELIFENYNELGDRIEECLSIELMGKHSNVVLYNTENNIILGCAHNIGEEKSRERELAGGLPYIYPPKQKKKNFLLTKFNDFEKTLNKADDTLKKTLNSHYFSLSQFCAQELCEKEKINPDIKTKDLTQEEMQRIFISVHEFLDKKEHNFSVSNDYKIYSCINKLERSYSTINELIDDYFSYHTESALVSTLKTKLVLQTTKEIKKLKNTYENQKKQLEKKEKQESYIQKGNLLIANIHKIPNGINKISLEDYVTGEIVEIQLDETKSPSENAQKYFALYNKIKKAVKVAEEMISETTEEINYFEQILYDTQNCSSYRELKEIEQELSPETSQNNKKKEEDSKIEKTEIDGFTIYIGKNNKQNDYLYSKISSPDDLWFHALNTPGSHVIVKFQNSSQRIEEKTILKIAKIAKQNSRAKNAAKASVVYTLRKYIKRPNKTKSGFVVYKNETEIVTD